MGKINTEIDKCLISKTFYKNKINDYYKLFKSKYLVVISNFMLVLATIASVYYIFKYSYVGIFFGLVLSVISFFVICLIIEIFGYIVYLFKRLDFVLEMEFKAIFPTVTKNYDNLIEVIKERGKKAEVYLSNVENIYSKDKDLFFKTDEIRESYLKTVSLIEELQKSINISSKSEKVLTTQKHLLIAITKKVKYEKYLKEIIENIESTAQDFLNVKSEIILNETPNQLESVDNSIRLLEAKSNALAIIQQNTPNFDDINIENINDYFNGDEIIEEKFDDNEVNNDKIESEKYKEQLEKDNSKKSNKVKENKQINIQKYKELSLSDYFNNPKSYNGEVLLKLAGFDCIAFLKSFSLNNQFMVHFGTNYEIQFDVASIDDNALMEITRLKDKLNSNKELFLYCNIKKESKDLVFYIDKIKLN